MHGSVISFQSTKPPFPPLPNHQSRTHESKFLQRETLDSGLFGASEAASDVLLPRSAGAMTLRP
jgi:hypothetical protein